MNDIFKQGIFSIDPNATPEMLERRREALQKKQYGSARNVGTGITDLLHGIISGKQRKNFDEFEGGKRAEATDMLSGITGGGTSGPLSILGMRPGTSFNPEASTAPQPAPAGDMAGILKGKFSDRNIPEHIADAFIMNWKDESGLNPGINEIEPLVPGSRGGFGLGQWTGPRRVAYEKFARDRGVPLDDIDAQVDFTLHELGTTESAAAKHIFAAPDAGSAAAAIVNKFLRPAEEHRARRVARYTGGATSAPQGAAQPSPQAPMADLLAASQNPWLNPQQRAVINNMIQAQQQQSDPLYQLQIQQAQVDLDQSQQPQPGYRQVTGADLGMQGEASTQMFNVGPDGKVTQIGGGGTNVTLNNLGDAPALPEYPKAPSGFVYKRSPDGQIDISETGVPTLVPMIGGPEDDAEISARAEQNRETSTSIISTAAKRARLAARGRTVGGLAGQAVGAINPGSQNAEVYRQTEVLKSNAKIENLNAMRAASKTGGALGSVTEKESQMLADKSGALDPASPNFERDLDDYERTLLQVVHGFDEGNRIFEQSRGPSEPAENPFMGMTEEEFSKIDISGLTPEQIDQLFEARSK